MTGKKNSKWLITMTKKFGSREALTEHMKRIGSEGGKNGRTGGFAANRELARIAGARGGSRSKRGKARVIA